MSSQSKSITLALTLTALAALSGCDKPPGAAKPPAEAPKPVAPATSAATPEPELPQLDPDAGDLRKLEAKLLKELGQLDARQGPTLTLLHKGVPALVLTDDEETNELLTGVFEVPTAHGVQTVYEITTSYMASPGPSFATFYDERGVKIESYMGFGQWRGAVFAIAYAQDTFAIDDDGRVSAQLLDWSSKPHRRFDFKSRCQPETWVSDTEINGFCVRPTRQDGTEALGEEKIDAVFTRVGPNAWRVRELRAPKAKLADLPDNPPTAFDETVKGVPYSGNQ